MYCDAKKITLLGGILNILLSISKLVAGIIGNSTAMIADAIHSLSDLISDAIAIIGIKIAEKPADSSHHYGHGKYETIAAYFISMLVAITGIYIFINNFKLIWNFIYNDKYIASPGLIAAFAALLSILVKELLFQATVKIGKKCESNAVIANAWHHRSDALSSIAAFIGITAAHFLGNKYAVLDPIAALVVSILIIIAGVKLFLGNLNELAEASLNEEENKEILNIVTNIQGATMPHNLKTRRIGGCISIELHIRVDGNLNIIEGHKIATDVEKALRKTFGKRTYINIHVEPLYEN